MTTGSGNNAREILEDSVIPISQALRSRSESSKVASVSVYLGFIIFLHWSVGWGY